jgi:hypothetical protein
MASFAQHTVLQTVNFEQASPSDTWAILHNFPNPVAVDVMVDIEGYGRVKMVPLGVDCNTVGTVIITFSAPYSGVARIAS